MLTIFNVPLKTQLINLNNTRNQIFGSHNSVLHLGRGSSHRLCQKMFDLPRLRSCHHRCLKMVQSFFLSETRSRLSRRGCLQGEVRFPAFQNLSKSIGTSFKILRIFGTVAPFFTCQRYVVKFHGKKQIVHEQIIKFAQMRFSYFLTFSQFFIGITDIL